MLDAQVLAVANIPVGDHVLRDGFDLDTIWTTALAATVVLGLGFYMRRRVTSSSPACTATPTTPPRRAPMSTSPTPSASSSSS
jgi:hypothetical protein